MEKQGSSYHKVVKINHWLSAIVVIFLFSLGFWMVDLTYYSSWYQTAPYWHKSIGLLFAAFTLFRLGCRLVTKTPPIDGSKFEKIAAKGAHIIMYILLFGLFCSGYLISTSDGQGIDIFTWYTIPALGQLFSDQSDIAGLIHKYVAYSLIALAVVHVIAALKHHFIDKDNTLQKMTGVN